MSIDQLRTTRNRHVSVAGLDVWVEERGEGPPVLLLAGLSDPVEAWQAQLDGLADRYHLIAFDNPGAGRTALPEQLDMALFADVAAGVLDELGVEAAHLCGFSGGSANAQHVALRRPDLVRSLTLVSTWSRQDAYLRSLFRLLTWLPEQAPDERAMLEAFFLFIYTARAHESGMVEQVIQEAFEFPYPQSPDAFLAQLAAWDEHDTYDQLPQISVPTLVVAGAEDVCTPARAGKVVADRIPGARFEVLEGEAHQPFQESPESFNERIDAFWREVDA